MWALKGGVLGFSFSGVTALAWNESEPYRIAMSIKNGSHFVHYQSKDLISQELCPVSLDEIKRRMGLSIKPSLIGIVGPRVLGSLILWLLWDMNSKMLSNSLWIQAILFEMREQVYSLPWPFTRLRLSSIRSNKLIANVFQKVRQDTGIPVTLLLDINTKTQNLGFSCKNLTRELKEMVCDDELMQCVFVASEGLLFQAQAQLEPRLKLLFSWELSIDASVTYLKRFEKMENVRFPRIFENLDDYGSSQDKKAYFLMALQSRTFKFSRNSMHRKESFWKLLSQKKMLELTNMSHFTCKKRM